MYLLYGILGQLSDVATTLYFQKLGISEWNPLYPEVQYMIAAKLLMIGLCSIYAFLRGESAKMVYTVLGSIGFFAALWNLGVIVGL